ncbi:hypothetical protein PGH12_05695 [Chryseobacterium wangxinyae]|uniref:hypothetical protein n=1 Tax=Chryseobacterium sp. CY350 TaxID=2997336 RepID=UPI00226FC22F|nr:hypothetical protein [Chryseobacterium sp. CY350]MCY0976642.1 hypothetical protein [Chryseobacterium sp. CY350]WBZ96643.1 hypothetical protein PGH12_05695 [Chryseobacterium sp. CY350]
MKLKFLPIALVAVSTFVYAQEVKVKKGEIQIDGKSVAKIDKEKNNYTISDLSGKALFTATITSQTPLKNNVSKNWLQLTGSNGVVRELELIDKTSFSFGFEKPITENLTKSSDPLLPASGIDENKINSFFQTEDRSISAAEDIRIEKDKETNRSEDALAADNKILISSVGIISANNQKIGYIVRKVTGTDGIQKFLSYTVLDINKIPVAQIDFSSYDKANIQSGLVLKTFDGKSFPIKLANYTSERLEYDELAPRVVKKLYANGYTLGDMKSTTEIAHQENAEANNQQNNDAESQAKANSKNIYNIPGYVIDKDGTKKNGKITIMFESIAVKLGVNDTKAYGDTATLHSSDKTEFLKAKDGVKFCAGERCFLGVAGTSSLGGSIFCEILSENNGSYVLKDLRYPEDYYLKLANQPKAVYLGEKGGFGKRKPEKIKKAFDEYVSCPSLDFSKYDTKTKEGLVQVLADYSSQCKK